jgi:hypothetical protein
MFWVDAAEGTATPFTHMRPVQGRLPHANRIIYQPWAGSCDSALLHPSLQFLCSIGLVNRRFQPVQIRGRGGDDYAVCLGALNLPHGACVQNIRHNVRHLAHDFRSAVIRNNANPPLQIPESYQRVSMSFALHEIRSGSRKKPGAFQAAICATDKPLLPIGTNRHEALLVIFDGILPAPEITRIPNRPRANYQHSQQPYGNALAHVWRLYECGLYRHWKNR